MKTITHQARLPRVTSKLREHKFQVKPDGSIFVQKGTEFTPCILPEREALTIQRLAAQG